jgi:isoleucyl-tRNA synthetase
VLDQLFGCLTAWLAPVLVFTAEEAWLARFPSEDDSVHLRLFPEVPAEWLNPALAAEWEQVRRVRRVVTGALEVERRDKRIGSSLEASPVVYLAGEEPELVAAKLKDLDFAEVCITSGIQIVVGALPEGAYRLDDVPGVGVVPARAEGEKCARCWQILPEVGEDSKAPDLCRRCRDAVAARAAA